MTDSEQWEEMRGEIRKLRTRVTALEHGKIAEVSERAEAVGEGGQLNDDEWRAKVADLNRELAGARRVAENMRRVANERTDERDAAIAELERLRLDLEERAESPCEGCAGGDATGTHEEDAP